MVSWGVYSVPAWAPVGTYEEWYWNHMMVPNSPTQAFHINELVLCRNKRDDVWTEGVLTSISPLKVKRPGDWFSHQYDEVEKFDKVKAWDGVKSLYKDFPAHTK